MGIIPELDDKVIATMFSFSFNMPDQQAGKGIEKEKQLGDGHTQVQQVIVSFDMRQFMQEDGLYLFQAQVIDHGKGDEDDRSQKAKGHGPFDHRRKPDADLFFNSHAKGRLSYKYTQGGADPGKAVFLQAPG